MARKPKDLTADYFRDAGDHPPPDGLPDAAGAMWREAMATTPEAQWRPGDLPLLAIYCRTALLAAEAIGHLERDGQVIEGRASPWVRVASDHNKTLALLAAKMRLAPSSRIRPEAHSLQQMPAGPKPWECGSDDELIPRPGTRARTREAERKRT